MNRLLIVLSCTIVIIASAIIAADNIHKVHIHVDSQYHNDCCSCEDELKEYKCSTFDLGMKCLNFVKAQKEMKILTISNGRYGFSSSQTGHFNNVDNIMIRGLSTSSSTIYIVCSEGVGFSFTNSSNVTIRGLTFVYCGQLQNSTSVNQTTNMFIKTIVTMYFLYCKNITIANTNVLDTNGTALVFYNVVGYNTIASCSFKRNHFLQGRPGGGGIYIEYSYCKPYNSAEKKCASDNVTENFIQNGNFVLDQCHFINNVANISTLPLAYKYIFMIPAKDNHCALGTAGGVSLYLMGNASGNSITIMNSIFAGNVGLWGAGLFIQLQDAANNNFIDILNSSFTNNSVLYQHSNIDGTGGGGSRLAIFLYSKQQGNNTIIYSKCKFGQNKAYYGGGLSFYSNLWNANNNIQLRNCTFDGNTARIGSAVDFTITQWIDRMDNSQRIMIPHVNVTNCNFTCNHAISDGLIGLGAVNLNGVNIVVNGYANFIGNTESALSMTSSKFTVSIKSTVRFIRNKGRNGGAIALFGKVAINARMYSQFEFTENKAEYLGGAIYYTSLGIYDLIYSRDCFLHYCEKGSENCTASFIFADNTADGRANSIYAPTFLPCLRDLSFDEGYYKKELFCNNETWTYRTNNKSENCIKQLATAPTNIEVHQNKSESHIPGKLPVHINILGTNEGNDCATVLKNNNTLIANIINNNSTKTMFAGNHSHYHYISNYDLYLLGEEGTTVNVSLETMDPIAVKRNIIIEFQHCPPGFVFKKETFRCECAGSYADQVFCDQVKYEAHLARTSWMGNTPRSNKTLLVGFSPYVMKVSRNESILLPQNSSELNNYLCSPIHHRGTLCGDCEQGYGVTVNTKDYNCVKCDAKAHRINWLYYILSEFAPVTIFFILVFLFSMKITHGPLNSFVFFAQTVTTVIRMDAHGLTPIEGTVRSYTTFESIYMIPYDFWNLNFFRSLLPGFCLSPHLGTLSVLMLGYLTALYPVLLILLFVVILNLYNKGVKPIVVLVRPIHYILARFSQLTNLKQSITGGIAVFILMSYNKFANVSFNLIPTYHLFDAHGNKQETVFYHQGTKIFPQDGVWYFIIAILILCTFGTIPPAILAYPSLLKCLERFKCFQPYLMTGRYYPNHKLQAFLDEFHGCYRNAIGDNRMDCRWFASFYFLLRITLLLMFSQVNTWQQLYMLQSIVFLVCAMLFAIVRPYRQDWINNVDTCAFAILTTVSTLSLYNLQLATMQKKISITAFSIQFMLMMIPVVYCLSYYTFLLYKWCQQQKHLFTAAQHYNNECSLEDSTYLARFFDFIKASGRHQQRNNESLVGPLLAYNNLKDYGSTVGDHD